MGNKITKFYICTYCDFEINDKQLLFNHICKKHKLKHIYVCNLCNNKFLTKVKLNKHFEIHKYIETFKCQHCNKIYTNKSYYDKHILTKHKLNKCKICLSNFYGNSSMCRICEKINSTRHENIMSSYLDLNFGTEYLLSSNTKIKGNLCQKYRPDKLYGSDNLVIQIECDEHEHKYGNGNYLCDEKRISDIYDEFPGKQYIVIRWNPDSKLFTIEKKLEILLRIMNNIKNMKFETLIHIIYMFYSKNNKNISKNIPHSFIDK